MIHAEFKYNSEIIKIESKLDENIEKICKGFSKKVNKDINKFNFIYAGKQLNFNKLIYEEINNMDKERKIMSILALGIDSTIKNSNNIIKSDHIICPLCKESARIGFENFKIKIYDCKYEHITYLLFNEFEDTQNIDESKILCQECGTKNKSNTYNKLMYLCNTCGKNLCPLCKEKHIQNHTIINYEQKYYICEKHNRSFSSFCNNCKKDICILCETEHHNHEIISYTKIIQKTDLLNNIYYQKIKKPIDAFNDKITLLVDKLDNIKKNLEINNNSKYRI